MKIYIWLETFSYKDLFQCLFTERFIQLNRVMESSATVKNENSF